LKVFLHFTKRTYTHATDSVPLHLTTLGGLGDRHYAPPRTKAYCRIWANG